ncbi:MAG: hypothetical protein FWB99_01065 [Treponema sp.]|nr:hypothetical protein [Treponema sp.]
MKHVFVFDPEAFYNQQWKMDLILDTIQQFFRKQDKPDISVKTSRYRRNAMLIIQEEVERAKPGDIVRIYAVGGEGILFDCLNAAAHFPNTQLASVPFAGSNDFIKVFGTANQEAFRDMPTLIQSKALPTDILKWGDYYALNSCCVGVNAVISKKPKSSSPRQGRFIARSRLSYLLTLFNRQVANQRYSITIDDTDYSGHYSLIHAANGPYHNGRMTGASGAAPNDGLMDIALVKSSYPLRALVAMRMYSRGRRPGNCVYLRAKKMTIESDSPMWIQFDSEYIQDTRISLDLVNEAVQIVAAKDSSYPSIPALSERVSS